MAGVLGAVGCEVLEAGDVGHALATVRTGAPDVLLLDARIDRDGQPLSVLEAVKSDPDLFRVAVVLAAPGFTLAQVLEALDHGAHDVIDVPVSPPELVARMRAASRARALQGELLAREEALEGLAYSDDLTGLANRRFAMRQLAAQLSRARRHDEPLALLLADIDHFKALNDDHGHLAGDAVLRAVALRLRSRLRQEDVIGRFGGEEFLIALPETDARGALRAAEALRGVIADAGVDVDGRLHRVSISIGWAMSTGEDVDGLIRRADDALYAAKRAGRNCVREAAGERAT